MFLLLFLFILIVLMFLLTHSCSQVHFIYFLCEHVIHPCCSCVNQAMTQVIYASSLCDAMCGRGQRPQAHHRHLQYFHQHRIITVQLSIIFTFLL